MIDVFFYISVAVAILILIGIILSFSVVKINPYERGVYFSQNTLKSVLEPGYHFIVPIGSSVVKVDLREQKSKIREKLEFADGKKAEITYTVFYKATAPVKAVTKIAEWGLGTQTLTKTLMRSMLGDFDLKYFIENAERIADTATEYINEGARKWGTRVTKIEIEDVIPLVSLKKEIWKERFRKIEGGV